MKITVTARLKPDSKKGLLLVEQAGGSLLIYVRERALEGRANKAAVKLLADHYDVPKSNIKIISGYKSKTKLFEINTK